jgi:hypothetical protein
MNMTLDELKEYAQTSNLVQIKDVGNGLHVLKYKRKVFYDGLWNEYLEECRGLIVDDDFNIVSYPFTKIYNYGVEKNAPKIYPDEMVQAVRKVNGFMVAVTWFCNDILISTTGSIDSDYVKMAKELIEPNIHRYRETCSENPSFTFMFECVHRNDPHIIPEKEGMYFLGGRMKELGSLIMINNFSHHEFGAEYVEHMYAPMEYIEILAKHVKHEGFVIYGPGEVATKIKSPYYLVKKFVARNPRTDKLMRADIKQSIDEEYYPLIDAIQQNIEMYTALDEQQRLEWVRKFLEK